MKNIRIIPILLLVISFSYLGCSGLDCRVQDFSIETITIDPRIISEEDNNTQIPWNNELNLPINRLAIRMDFPKTFEFLPEQDEKCLPRFRNSNRVKSMRLVSSQNFNENFLIGDDLFDIVLFAQVIPRWIEDRFAFKNDILNQSNFATYLFVFNIRPEMEALHVLQVIFEMEDGTTIMSNEIEVRLIPLV